MTAPKHKGFIVNTKKKNRSGGKTAGSWKPGQSGNPKGSPKKQDTWGAIFKRIGDMTGPELVAALEQMKIVDEFARLPASMKLKEVMAVSVYSRMLTDPTPGLLEQIMERTEGKVEEKLSVKTSKTIVLDHNAQPLGQVDVDEESG